MDFAAHYKIDVNPVGLAGERDKAEEISNKALPRDIGSVITM